MGVFPDHQGRKIIVPRPPPMRKILGAITHQPTTTTDKPAPREGKVKVPMTPGYKKRQASTSPNGGFFSHPAFKNRASPVKRRREGLSPKGKVSVVGGGRKRVEEREKVCKKLGDVRKSRPRLVVSDDEPLAIASSSGAHPSSDVHDYADVPTRHIKFADVVDTLPPSSPPVFAQDDEDDMMMMMDLSSSPRMPLQASTSPTQNAPLATPTIIAPQQAPSGPHTPPRHQKPRISACTLPPSDELPALKITYDGTYPLVLGRSRRLAAQPHVTKDKSEIVPVPMALAHETALHLIDGNPEDAKLAPLPRTASHASRAHVLIQVTPAADAAQEQIQLHVLGQNGCKIRQLPAGPAERFAAGGIVKFTRARGEKVKAEVDMYSCRAIVEWLSVEEEVEEPITQTLPPTTIDDDLAQLVQTPIAPSIARRIVQPIPAETPSPARSIHSQMTYDNPSDDEQPLPLETPSRQVKKEWMDAAEMKNPFPARTLTSEATPDAPVDIDLKALVATSLVFSGSSAISAPDLVKSILDVSSPHPS